MSILRLAFSSASAAIVLSAGIANAAPTVQTSLAAWEAAQPGFQETLLSPASSTTNLALNGGATLNFNTPMSIFGSGVVPGLQLAFTGANVSSFTGIFAAPVTAFGFFAEAFEQNIFNITLDLLNGQSVTLPVNSSQGPEQFFGWTGGPITSFTVTAANGPFGISPDGVGIGDFFVGVPEPSSLALTLVGFGITGLGMFGRSRRRNAMGAAA